MRRRQFLTSLLAAGAAPALTWADAGAPAFLAAAREPDGRYVLIGLREDGGDAFRVEIPDRGHAAAAHPTAPEAVAFARRPGTFALVLDCVAGRVLHRLDAPAGRHFYGHGAFVDDGALLVTTENDIDSGAGRLGIWSRESGYARVGDIASGGIGPHEILALPGDVLAVANGGIRTHPDQGRDKLNLDSMRPNLSYLTVDGTVAEIVELEPELHQASIRHLAAQDGLVAFAMQWQGGLPDPVPLLGLHRRDAPPVLCKADLGEQMAMDGYAGSVAIGGGRVVITSPRGGRVQLFDLSGRHQTTLRRSDICGVSARGGAMMATDGLGGVHRIEQDRLRPVASAPRSWDNHLVRIGV